MLRAPFTTPSRHPHFPSIHLETSRIEPSFHPKLHPPKCPLLPPRPTVKIMSNLTDRQLDANRHNAALSTGPRTEEGKARSSQNAMRTGWFAQELHIAAPQQSTFTAFEQAFLTELAPQGCLELEAFSDFIRAAWHKREVVAALNSIAESDEPHSFLKKDEARELDRLHKYEASFERRAQRAVAELRRFQEARRRATPEQTQSRSLAPDLASSLAALRAESGYLIARARAQKAGLDLAELAAMRNFQAPPWVSE